MRMVFEGQTFTLPQNAILDSAVHCTGVGVECLASWCSLHFILSCYVLVTTILS